MPQVQAQRRLVKSPPELWTELSDAAALSRHLGEFGEIRITRLEPETKVVWEGDRANGSVRLASAGWGTQVTLTVEVEESEPEPEPIAVEPEPDLAVLDPEPFVPVSASSSPAPRRGFLARLFNWDDRRVESVMESARETVAVEPHEPEPKPEPVAVEPEPEPEPEAVAVEPEPEPDAVALLEHVLDQLGQAHHRPFSRA